MKSSFTRLPVIVLGATLAGLANGAYAQDATTVAVEVNKGDVAWIMTSTLLVLMMALPGLALFYGGLVRAKNMLSVLMQVMTVFSLNALLFALYGYSLAFTEGSAFIGSMDKVFLSGVTIASLADTFTANVKLPEFAFIAFQATFAGITGALIVGAFAERMRFSAVLIFSVIWFSFCYLPICHMVWGPGGYLLEDGALDFAGGTVVHINAGIAGLVGAYMVGKRVGLGRVAMAPHNLTLTMVGAALLWVGWFGFNAGSNLEANAGAALAFINTLLATAAAVLAWSLGEALVKGQPSMLGAASGAVAGLVAITPACGTVGPMGAIVIGALSGFICLWGVNGLKHALGADDAVRRVWRPWRGRHRRRAADRRVRRARARWQRWRGLRHRRASVDPDLQRDHHHRVVCRGRLCRLQDRRPDGRPARGGRRRAQGPGHQRARRNGVSLLSIKPESHPADYGTPRRPAGRRFFSVSIVACRKS